MAACNCNLSSFEPSDFADIELLVLSNGFSESYNKTGLYSPFPQDEQDYVDDYDYEDDSDLDADSEADVNDEFEAGSVKSSSNIQCQGAEGHVRCEVTEGEETIHSAGDHTVALSTVEDRVAMVLTDENMEEPGTSAIQGR